MNFKNINYNWTEKTILIVEDDEMNYYLTKEILKTDKSKFYKS